MSAVHELWASIVTAPDQEERLRIVAWAEAQGYYRERETAQHADARGFSFRLEHANHVIDLFFYYDHDDTRDGCYANRTSDERWYSFDPADDPRPRRRLVLVPDPETSGEWLPVDGDVT